MKNPVLIKKLLDHFAKKSSEIGGVSNILPFLNYIFNALPDWTFWCVEIPVESVENVAQVLQEAGATNSVDGGFMAYTSEGTWLRLVKKDADHQTITFFFDAPASLVPTGAKIQICEGIVHFAKIASSVRACMAIGSQKVEIALANSDVQ